MRRTLLAPLPFALGFCLAAACGDDATPLASDDGGAPVGDATTAADSGPSTADSGAAAKDGAVGADSGGPADSGPGKDPSAPGPVTFTVSTVSVTAAATGDTFSTIVARPDGAGPFPVVVFGHGFQVSASLYKSYAEHLASHGYLAAIPDFPTGFSANHVRDAKDLLATVDTLTRGVGAVGDERAVGLTGHSRGGKAAVLAAGMDARVRAVLGLDPVDAGSFGCNTTTECPPVGPVLAALTAPAAFLGETLDATGSFGQACAPTSGNFKTFFTAAKSPSFAVDVLGASHMSFLDDPNCGFACSACKTATAPHDRVLALAKGYEVAYFDRHLRGDRSADAWLTGPLADARWVQSGAAQITTK